MPARGFGLGLPFSKGRHDALAGANFIALAHSGNNVPNTFYQDTACTIPAILAGDAVKGVKRNNVIYATQGTAGKWPLLRFQNAEPCLRFDGVDDFLMITTAFSLMGKAVLLLHRSTGADFNLLGAATNLQLRVNYTNVNSLSTYDGATLTGPQALVTSNTNRRLIQFRFAAGAVSFWDSTTQQGAAVATNDFTVDRLGTILDGSFGFCFDRDLIALVVCPIAQANQIASYLLGIHVVLAPTNIIVQTNDLYYTVTFNAVPDSIEYEWHIDATDVWINIDTDLTFAGKSTAGVHTVSIRARDVAGVIGSIGTSANFTLMADDPSPTMLTRPSMTSAGTSVGNLQTATPGTYSQSPTSYVREWRRDGVAIGGAVGLTYNLAVADQGTTLSFYEKAVNASGNSGFIRATTGIARQFYLMGDSLFVGVSGFVQAALDTQFGMNAFIVTNLAGSGINYNTSAFNFGILLGTSVAPVIDPTWGIVFSFDYANQFFGLAGPSTGIAGRDIIFNFAADAVTAKAAGHIYCTSPYPNGAYGTHGYDGSAAYLASEAIANGYQARDGMALVDFRDSALTASILANDDLHWAADKYAYIATKIATAMATAEIVGGCGGLDIP